MTPYQFIFALTSIINTIATHQHKPDSVDIKKLHRKYKRGSAVCKYVDKQFILQAAILELYIKFVGGENA